MNIVVIQNKTLYLMIFEDVCTSMLRLLSFYSGYWEFQSVGYFVALVLASFFEVVPKLN